MTRYEIINHLIKKHGYLRYLEIGTQKDDCLSKVQCKYKVGVEPFPVFHDSANSDKFHKKLSDDYFCKNVEKFDIICLFHVFEHIKNPFEFLKQCQKLLNKNGIIYSVNNKSLRLASMSFPRMDNAISAKWLGWLREQAKTNWLTALGWWIAICCAMQPPMEWPIICALSIFYACINATVSSAITPGFNV